MPTARTNFSMIGLALSGAVSLGGALASPLVQSPPVSVIELFTSQGCSSCPPADDNFRALSDQPGVLALSFGVTYWDSLGWKDTFAQSSFTQRQVAYAKALHHDGPFTPEVVVDGRADVVGSKPLEIQQLAARTRLLGGPEVRLGKTVVDLAAARLDGPPADVWLVRYDPRTLQTPIKAGENGGRTLTHKNVVRELKHLGVWRGSNLRFDLPPPSSPGLQSAILVQAPGGGPILSAARS